MKRRWWPPAIGLGYIALVWMLGGMRRDHVMIGMLGFLDLYNERTRRFLWTFLPFMLTGVIFDSMRYYYAAGIDGRVHVAEPYMFERRWFGIGGQTLNEIFVEHHWVAADIAAGFAYLVFVAEYLGLAFVLFFRGLYAQASTFARCFLLVNVMGFATYFIYPAAPPWYVATHGFGPADLTTAPSPAAAHRFDQLFGTHLFDAAYGKGIDVFGAIPSLHVAYPLIAVVLAFRMQALRWARGPAVAFLLLMCFSAIYLQHHYVLDVVLGLAYATIAVTAVTAWERRRDS